MPQKKHPTPNYDIRQFFCNGYKRNLKNQKQGPLLKLLEEECKKYSIKEPYPQRFSLPENIVYYISRNPINLQCHRKLIKTCKYIFRHSRIIPVDNFEYYCPKKSDVIFMNNYASNKNVSLNFESLPSFKIWMHYYLSISSTKYSNLASTLTKILYQCSLEFLRLYDQVLTIGELQILAGGGKLHTINFRRNVVKNDDGSITEFEKVFEILLCKKMDIWFHSEQHGVGNNTAKKIAEILESQRKSYRIRLSRIPLIFDFNTFSEFLKDNMANRKHNINLNFFDIPSDEYKNQLQQFVNQIIQIHVISGRAVPIVEFSGQNEAAYKQLQNMRNKKFL